MLPPFLSPASTPIKHDNSLVSNAVFHHKPPLGPVHAHWWAPKDTNSPPKTVVLFIPGNPGLIEFYTPFLDALHHNGGANLGILAHGHIDHAPSVGGSVSAEHSLTSQVQNAVEAFDAIASTYGNGTKVVLIGHSVGSWICLQIVKQREIQVSGAFLLFPTVSHIATTPNGKILSCLFNPIPRWIISHLGYLGRMIPTSILGCIFSSWPTNQVAVLQDLVGSPRAIEAALRMAHDEMETIKDLDLALLESSRDKLRFYYALRDDWVGGERERLLANLHPSNVSVKVVHDEHGIPHAFCINHGDVLAKQCLQWLKEFEGRTLNN
ncbi:alpha/beta-hydrolase [Coprinopsis marcescibilis]|uniref:Alpha/beta-hydrolase n=1 Tax=Coprinopsis marcescibilis TaxID=230819 RepID=A0A5C3LF81_COPMA|nr:alpha/beta-hydrolase [Coprinopsis marcescibilis]